MSAEISSPTSLSSPGSLIGQVLATPREPFYLRLRVTVLSMNCDAMSL